MTSAGTGGNGAPGDEGKLARVTYLSYDIPIPDGLFRQGWARYLYPSVFLRYTTVCSAVAYNWDAARLQEELEGIGFTPANDRATRRDQQRVEYCFNVYREAGIEPPVDGRDEVRLLKDLGLVTETRRQQETVWTLVLPVPAAEERLKPGR